MKLSCTQENLIKGVSIASRIVGTRGTLPILSHLLLNTEKGRLKLIGTDLEIAIITLVGAKVEKEGSLTVPGKLFNEFVSSIGDKTIELEKVNNSLKVFSENVSAELNGLDPQDFPLIPQIDEKNSITISARELKSAINEVIFAVAYDETRPVLTGVYCIVEKSQLTLVATDSYRLAERRINYQSQEIKPCQVIVPSRTMHELIRLLDISGEDVKISFTPTQISFTLDTIQIISRVIEGNYPDYQQIIPKESKTKIVVESKKLQSALKLAISFSRDVSNNVRLQIKEGEPMKIIAASAHVGSSIIKVEKDQTGEDLEIAFNGKFLLDILTAISDEKARMEFNGNLSSVVILPEKQTGYKTLVMPLKLEE